jgi:hypothetical protein
VAKQDADALKACFAENSEMLLPLLELMQMDIVNYDVRLHDNYDGRSTGVIVAVNWL